MTYGKSIANLFLLLFSTLILISCYGSEAQNNSENQNQGIIPAVEAVQARFGSLPLSERLSGTVYAENQVSLYPEVSGKIAEVHVQSGAYVEKGDPLVTLDNVQYREQVEQAEAELSINQARLKQAKARYNEIEAQYNRLEKLSSQNLSSEMEMEMMKAQLLSAEADVELAKAQVKQSQSNLNEQKEILSETVIRAPISGTVGERNAEVGMRADTNTPLFTIGNLNAMEVEVVLTNNMLSDVKVGQTALIYTNPNSKGEQQIIEAELSRISPFLNNVTRSTEAEIDVKNQKSLLRPGMFVSVDILYGESQQATLIPTSALYSDPITGQVGVFVATALGTEIKPIAVDSNRLPPLTQPTEVQFKPVNVLAEGAMEVGVTGVEPGSWVITVGQNLLSQGRGEARVRTITWERILALQSLQRQDLLRKVLEEQHEENPT